VAFPVGTHRKTRRDLSMTAMELAQMIGDIRRDLQQLTLRVAALENERGEKA
jgi:hypothetical protein